MLPPRRRGWDHPPLTPSAVPARQPQSSFQRRTASENIHNQEPNLTHRKYTVQIRAPELSCPRQDSEYPPAGDRTRPTNAGTENDGPCQGEDATTTSRQERRWRRFRPQAAARCRCSTHGPVSTKGSMAHEKNHPLAARRLPFQICRHPAGQDGRLLNVNYSCRSATIILPIAARLMFDQLLLSPTPCIGGRPVSPASRPSVRRLRWARSVGVFACDSSAR